jgi:hypothetical protein
MGRALVTAAGFATSGGVAADAADAVFVARLPDRYGRLLLAAVEPLDPAPRGRELAAVVLRALRETFAVTPGDASAALLAAFAAANAALLAENRALAAGRPARRFCVGATAVALAGREIVVAQAPPTQALLSQDGQVYAFPEVASWRGDFIPEESPDDAHPLGFAEHAPPRLYQSLAVPGDLIALCATGIGRAIARDEDAVLDLFGGALLTTDLEGSVDRLERLLADHDLDDGFAVVAQISRLGSRPLALPSWPRSHRTTPHLTAADANDGSDQAASLTPRPRFEGLRDWAIERSEVASMQRREHPPASVARRRALAAPGALSVRRYREGGGLPAEWRANLPRTPALPVPSRFLAVSLVLLLTLGGAGAAMGYQRDREVQAAAALAATDASLRGALETPGMAMSAIAEAETALARASAAGAGGEALLRRQRDLARVRDDVWRVDRLLDVERIGALPTAGAEGPVRLALAGRTLYLAAGDLFALDAEDRRLLLLLARGDAVPGGAVGDLRHVSVDGGQIVASDGESLYTRDALGGWQRRSLAVEDVGGLRPETPLVVWGEAGYGLSWDGDIVRFEQGAGGPMAAVWAEADEAPELESARDFAIDGRIHVLLADGRTLTFSRGDLAGTITPFVVPLLTDAALLAEAPFANALYLVDGTAAVGENTGRIVRVDAGGEARQYLTPLPFPGDPGSAAVAAALAGVQDVAIDELAGTVYWVTRGELWRARLPST